MCEEGRGDGGGRFGTKLLSQMIRSNLFSSCAQSNYKYSHFSRKQPYINVTSTFPEVNAFKV